MVKHTADVKKMSTTCILYCQQ